MRRATLLTAFVVSGCDAYAGPVVDLEIKGFEIPAELDSVHLELSDESGLFAERTYTLRQDESSPSIWLKPGDASPARAIVTVFGLSGTRVVAQSQPVAVIATGTDLPRTTIELGRPP